MDKKDRRYISFTQGFVYTTANSSENRAESMTCSVFAEGLSLGKPSKRQLNSRSRCEIWFRRLQKINKASLEEQMQMKTFPLI